MASHLMSLSVSSQLIISLSIFSIFVVGQQNICGSNKTLGLNVISVLNLTYPGLEGVAAAVSQGNYNDACEELALYYQTSNTSNWLRIPPVKPGSGLAGGVVDEMVFNDTFYLSGVAVTAKVPRNADGGIDWLYRGPYNDPEFMNCLNRFDSMTYLLAAWRETGNYIYVNYFNALVVDWVSHVPCPDALLADPPAVHCLPAGLTGGPLCAWGDADLPGTQSCQTGTMESPWRSLEMGIRMQAPWPAAFFGFQRASNFSTSARALMVLGIGEHNAALAVDGGHPGQGTPNWEMTQWQGLVVSCATWPELKNCSQLLALAFQELEALLDDGVYPDGVETEEASGYDMGTAGDFFGAVNELHLAQLPPPPPSYLAKVRAMWAYGAYVSDPQGCLPRNGDSDLCGNGYSASVAQYFNASDWTYVHTNGAQGTVPPLNATQGPSSLFPWAGQVVLRSGYDAQATWIFFDVGPYGSSGHGHMDKLSVNLHARGSMLLVDSGRFSYAGTDLSATLHIQYARNSSAHNTLTIDECSQLPLPPVATVPVSSDTYSFTPERDTAYSNMSYYAGLTGTASHQRAVYYQRVPGGSPTSLDGDWLVVIDVLSSDRPRLVESFWHTHPNSTGVSFDAATGIAVVGGVNFATGQPTTAQACLIPAMGGGGISSNWSSIALLRGQQQNLTAGIPWQGWYSQTYDDAWPSSTFVYQAHVPKTALFAWLIIPTAVRATCDESTANILVTAHEGSSVAARIQIGKGTPIDVQIPIGA